MPLTDRAAHVAKLKTKIQDAFDDLFDDLGAAQPIGVDDDEFADMIRDAWDRDLADQWLDNYAHG